MHTACIIWFNDFSNSYGPLMNSALYIAHSPCLLHNSLTIANIFMKLNYNVYVIEAICRKQGPQLLITYFLIIFPCIYVSFTMLLFNPLEYVFK